MDAFTVVFGGMLAFFVVAVMLLGLFSERSARDYLDWKPDALARGRGARTRSTTSRR